MGSKIYRIIELPYEKRSMRKVPLEHHVIPYRNKKHMIYFPLKGMVSLVNQSFVDKINTDDPVVKALFKLVSKQPSVEVMKIQAGTYITVLELTTDCNLRCIYCYAKGGDKPKYMDWKTAKTALDWTIKRCHGKIFSLVFHGGGEPTLAFDMMEKCYEYAKMECKKRNITLKLRCPINGILLTEDMVKWFKKNDDVQVFLSFDGPPEIQNTQRPLKNGGKSYPLVKRAIELLNEYDIKYYVNAIITDASLSRMTDIIKHMHSLNIKACDLARNWETGRCLETAIGEPDYDTYREKMEKVVKLAKRYNILINREYKMEFGSSSGLRGKFCYGCGHTFFVTAEGTIRSCVAAANKSDPTSKEFIYGKIENDKVNINKEKLEYLRMRSVDNMEECKNCFARYMCRGFCPIQTTAITGSIFKPSPKLCSIGKRESKELLVGLFNRPTTSKTIAV